MFNRVISVLKKPNHYRWLTAKGICHKLGLHEDRSTEIEQLLIHYFDTTESPEIRYSSLPSKYSLEILWGHVDKVGTRDLFDLFKEDDALQADYLKDIEDERNMFLSYSFKDTANVLQFAKHIIHKGIYPWIAQVDLYRNQGINEGVIDAIRNLDNYGIFLSQNTLNSTWSAKEFEFALTNKKKMYAFVQEKDQGIIDLIAGDSQIHEHMNIHGLLVKIFDNGQLSEQMEFYSISKNGMDLQRITRANRAL